MKRRLARAHAAAAPAAQRVGNATACPSARVCVAGEGVRTMMNTGTDMSDMMSLPM
jgi:hypothetical protein